MILKFIKEPDERLPQFLNDNVDDCKVEMSFNGECLPEIFENFANFLRACGFVIDNNSQLEVVNNNFKETIEEEDYEV